MDEAWLRQSIIDAALSMQQSGLSPQRSGNVSARFDLEKFAGYGQRAGDDVLSE